MKNRGISIVNLGEIPTKTGLKVFAAGRPLPYDLGLYSEGSYFAELRGRSQLLHKITG